VSGATLAGLAVFAGPSAILDATAVGPRIDRDLTDDLLAPYVGSTFRVSTPNGVMFPAVLVEVDRLPAHRQGRPSALRAPFALRFSAATAVAPDDGIFQVDHDALGAHEMFVTSAGSRPAGIVLTAVFS
jgi:hypothetical protein